MPTIQRRDCRTDRGEAAMNEIATLVKARLSLRGCRRRRDRFGRRADARGKDSYPSAATSWAKIRSRADRAHLRMLKAWLLCDPLLTVGRLVVITIEVLP